jgi:uncharacterized protein YgbK (DUF1537 family)
VGILLGAIGDDVTGSTDLGLMLSKHGMSVVQVLGLPPPGAAWHEAQALIVALKSRTAPPAQALADSLAACDFLVAQGARQIFFKYCSTFDSTAQGNIGPVADALLRRLEAGITIYCPAFPENGRTVYNGHLFVGSNLLSESGMQHHPLTPMSDSNLVRFLARQLGQPQGVGLISYGTVNQGPAAVRRRLRQLAGAQIRHVIVDALTDRHLFTLAEACADLILVTGGSGLAMGLPSNFRRAGLLGESSGPAELPKLPGSAVILSGSCSPATQRQVSRMSSRCPSLQVEPLRLAAGKMLVEDIAHWVCKRVEQGPVLIYATAAADQVAEVQAELGCKAAGDLIEKAMGELAMRFAQKGVRKFIVAGGETSGAVIEALKIRALRIGPEIAPGVPWTVTQGEPVLCLALKSGNFGDDDFFEKAIGMLP